jgi:hypothetical protein
MTSSLSFHGGSDQLHFPGSPSLTWSARESVAAMERRSGAQGTTLYGRSKVSLGWPQQTPTSAPVFSSPESRGRGEGDGLTPWAHSSAASWAIWLTSGVHVPARVGRDAGGRPARTHGEKCGCSVFSRATRRRRKELTNEGHPPVTGRDAKTGSLACGDSLGGGPHWSVERARPSGA